jgi:aspartate/methionine/tyrosine aminotransferase
MWFEEFALERWALDPRVAAARHDLASSAGRPWTLRELLELVAPSGEAEAVLDERLGYSSVQGRRELRQAVAHLYGADPESVRITCGASQALFLQIALAARPGANAVLPAPGYPAYRGLAKGFGLEVREIPLSRERGFVLDAEAVISHLDGDTPLVILTTPHNPTGSCLDRPTLEAIAAATADRGIPLVVDEVFHPIRHDGGSEESAAAIEDVIVIGDLSKALSLPGLRIGSAQTTSGATWP